MKAIVFGCTGFIGSHVVEQLAISKHAVTAAVRPASDSSFIKSLNIPIVAADFTDSGTVANAIAGHDIVYNCTANPKLHQSLESQMEVEIRLTRKIAEGAAKAGVKRFIQLSTVMVYGFSMPPEPIDETYPCKPEFPFQKVCLEREEAVKDVAKRTGLELLSCDPQAP